MFIVKMIIQMEVSVGEFVMFTKCRTYAQMDEEQAGSGLRLWISRNGISQEYRPYATASKGPAMDISDNGQVNYQQGFEWPEKLKA